ncbi:lipase-like [Olea europaea var. sylvestris]|uniref:lipase-like n=1 Tax=Olea europaea var. sylvestris TaxID=158386 RepID=UPI000C1CDB6C|nr:lipase-like [Olea europaea var. sylvestris]
MENVTVIHHDWTTDFDISWYKFDAINSKVHGRFMKALGLKLDGSWPLDDGAYNTITKDLKKHFENNIRTRFIITGHSLGGALAILFPVVLALHEQVGVLKRLIGVYTFGQPKVGDTKFGKFMDEMLESYGVKYYICL